MKIVELENFSWKGFLDAILMKENHLHLKVFKKTIHHAYIGLIFFAQSLALHIPFLNILGFSLLIHDIFFHIFNS
jgi:hypothetical protein